MYVDQRLHAFDRHRVVDRRAHAADRAVALELHHAARLRALEEGVVERLVAQLERHVHAASGRRLRHRVACRSALRRGSRRAAAALAMLCASIAARPPCALQPLEHQAGDVDRVGRRRVEHRVVVGLLLVVEGRRRDRQRLADQVVAHDHDREAGRADVLLRAAVDQAVAAHVDRPRQDVATTCRPPAARRRCRASSGTRRRRWSRWRRCARRRRPGRASRSSLRRARR